MLKLADEDIEDIKIVMITLTFKHEIVTEVFFFIIIF